MTMPSVPAPDDVQASIDIKLKANWTYDEDQDLFRGPRGKTFSAGDSLPSGARIVHKVPQLVQRPRASLTVAERDLCRYLQVVDLERADPEPFVAQIRTWPSVESVAIGPRCELPGMGPMPWGILESHAPPRAVEDGTL